MEQFLKFRQTKSTANERKKFMRICMDACISLTGTVDAKILQEDGGGVCGGFEGKIR